MISIKLGCCTSLWEDQILELPGAGADYAEVSFSSLQDKTLEEAKARASQLKEAGVTVEAMNVFFPGSLRLTGPEVDFTQVDRYLEKNLPKAAAFGTKVVVFGSGGSRRVPDGFPMEEAFSQLVTLCRDHIAPAVAAYGITCCVEPLNRQCNILNTSVLKASGLREAVGHPTLTVADLYHFD